MRYTFLIVLYLCFSCQSARKEKLVEPAQELSEWNILVLGVAQDAGYPQAGCNKKCCSELPSPKMVSCLALAHRSGKYWLFDATPDFSEQIALASSKLGSEEIRLPEAIFLTHAHIGHYTGLMNLGREVMGSKNQKVYAMPRMTQFLTENGPWSQLLSLSNIQMQKLTEDSAINLNGGVEVIPRRVPHRDEFSETVAYQINTPGNSVLFIPDIDKWERWNLSVDSMISEVDLAFLDGTFYADGEIPGRDMSEIPHPFMEESMNRFSDLPEQEKEKIHFIHFNHTNPVLWDRVSRAEVGAAGFGLAIEGRLYPL